MPTQNWNVNEMDEAAKGLSYESNSITRPPLIPLALNNLMNSRDSRHNNYRSNRNTE
jgi:hypothetical protein